MTIGPYFWWGFFITGSLSLAHRFYNRKSKTKAKRCSMGHDWILTDYGARCSQCGERRYCNIYY